MGSSEEALVKDLAGSLHSLLLLCVVLVVLVILVVCVECLGLIGWIISLKKKPDKAVSAKKEVPPKSSQPVIPKEGSKQVNISSNPQLSNGQFVSSQSRGRTTFPIQRLAFESNKIECSTASHSKPVEPLAVLDRDKSTSQLHPTTRAAESIGERSMKEIPVGNKEPGSGHSFKEVADPVGKEASVEMEQSPQQKSQLPKVEEQQPSKPEVKVLSKEDHKEKVRNLLRARKRFLGELPVAENKSLEELKPVVKSAEVRIDMPPDEPSIMPVGSFGAASASLPAQDTALKDVKSMQQPQKGPPAVVSSNAEVDVCSKPDVEQTASPLEKDNDKKPDGTQSATAQAETKNQAEGSNNNNALSSGSNFPYGSPV